MTHYTRSNILKEFASVDIGIMSNARCLVEGVNIPAVDTVAFIDPKRSLIDIVQATGRAMRKAEWKENGYIFIPVFLEEDSDPEEIIKSSDFSTVWEVLQAMLDQDQRIEGIVSKMRILQGKGEEGSKAWNDAMAEYAEKIEFYDLPVKIDQNRFIERLNTRIVEIIGRQWDFWYGLTLKYKNEFGNPNAPLRYKTAEGFPLGSWQSTQKYNYKKRNLSPDRIRRLEEVGFIWEIQEDQFEKGFQETLLYKERTGNPNAPAPYKTTEGYRLGAWQSNQRGKYKKGKLSPVRIKRLEDIGFVWNITNVEQNRLGWDIWYELTIRHKNEFDDPNAPASYKTEEGYLLGTWQGTQRKTYKQGNLSPSRIKLLEDIGFRWIIQEEQREEQFEKGFQETLLYKERTGKSNAPAPYKTTKGYRLGAWQSHQRGNYKKGILSSERIKRLEDISFTWDLLEELFEKGFQETLLYKERTGNPNALHNYKTPEGYPLNSWQRGQRQNYKKGKLSPDRIERLDAIAFKWDILDDQFEKGFQETLLYKERTGNPNAPASYKTTEGYRLGAWQAVKRNMYKKSNLSSDRIKRLEAIGFIWEVLEEKFEKGFRETLMYKKSTGSPNAISTYKTAEGYPLGSWQNTQRGKYIKAILSLDSIRRLEEIGFTWEILEEQFEKGFQETLFYKERTGNPNAPQSYTTSEGFKLGNWQGTQRRNYKKGKLSPDRFKRLEEIGFQWETQEEQFEKLFEQGFQETLSYKASTGNPNVPNTYNTAEGYHLGIWLPVSIFVRPVAMHPGRSGT